ncbi:MAG: hypothetical protein Q9191_007837 [Dirinaria sp. TL-2023a]
MEHRMRDFLEKAFRKFGSHFNSGRLQARINPQARLIEDEGVPQRLSKDRIEPAQTSLPASFRSDFDQSPSHEQLYIQPSLQSALDAQLMSLEPESRPVLSSLSGYPVQTNDLLDASHDIAHDSCVDTSCRSFPLTEDTVAQITEVLKSARELETLESSYESAMEKAEDGKSFLEFVKARTEGSDCPGRDFYLEEFEDRTPQIHADFQRRDTLEETLKDRKRELDYSRKRLERTLENILIDKQLYKVTEAEDNATLRDEMEVERRASVRSVGGQTLDRATAQDSLIDPYRSASFDMTPPSPEDPHSCGLLTDKGMRDRYEAAVEQLQMLQHHFDNRERVCEEQIQNYREALRNGEVDFPESEVRELHVQRNRELTQKLISAEFEFQEALDDCKEFGVLAEDDMSIMSCAEYDEEACSSEPEKLAAVTAMKDYSHVAVWVEQVTAPPEEDAAQPEIDLWGDEKSVSISSTFSMVEKELSNRLQIDRWRFYCSTFRDAKEEEGSGEISQTR